MNSEGELEKINGLHRDVHLWFFVSVPGFIWLATSLINEVGSGRFNQVVSAIAQERPVTSEPSTFLLAYAIPLAAWWVPFEIAESCMSKLKQRLRGFDNLPIRYTPVDRIVNGIMNIAHDRSPLP